MCSTFSSSSFSTCKRSNLFLRVSENQFLVSSSCNLTVLNLLLFSAFLIQSVSIISVLVLFLLNDGHLLRRLRALLLRLKPLKFCVAVISQSGVVVVVVGGGGGGGVRQRFIFYTQKNHYFF